MHYTTLHMNYILTRNSGGPTAPRRSFCCRAGSTATCRASCTVWRSIATNCDDRCCHQTWASGVAKAYECTGGHDGPCPRVHGLRHPGPQAGSAIEFSIQAKTEAGGPGISKISGRIFLCIFLCRHISGQRQHVPWDGSQSKIQSARLVRVHICSDHGIQNYEVSFSRGTQDQGFDTPTGRQTNGSALPPLHRNGQEATSKWVLLRQNVSQLWDAVVNQALWSTRHRAQQHGDIISRGTNKSQLAFKGLWTGKTWSGDKGGGAHHCQRCHLWREEHAMARELRYVSHNNVMPM